MPQSRLAPNTQYTLTGSWTSFSGASVSRTLRFTTGPGPLSTGPSAPTVLLQRYVWSKGSSRSGCDPFATGTCVAFPTGTVIEATYIDTLGQQSLPASYYRAPYLDSAFDTPNTNYVCLQLRARAANGTYACVGASRSDKTAHPDRTKRRIAITDFGACRSHKTAHRDHRFRRMSIAQNARCDQLTG